MSRAGHFVRSVLSTPTVEGCVALEERMGLSKDRVDHFVQNFDYHDPEFWTDPYPVYTEMRRRCPIARSGLYDGHWVLTKYEHVHAAFQDPETFSSALVSVPPELGQQRPMIPIQVDPPLHTRYRRLLAPAFSPQRIAAMEPEIRTRCRELIAGFAQGEEIEFIEAFAKPYPTSIFLTMMGLPQEDAESFLAWTYRIIHGFADDPEGELRIEAGMETYVYFAKVIDERMSDPRDDLISMLLHTEIDGEQLTDEEVLDICFLLFIAGLDTVTSSLGLSFLYLGQDDEARRRLRQDPSLIPAAVEELIRFESPISIARIATRDVDFFGCPIRKGDPVLILTGSADRDEDEFDHADEVIFERTPNRHLGFGAGPHRCLGSHLARIELRIALEEFHMAFGDYRVSDLGKVRRHAGPVGGIDYLPLSLIPSETL